MKEFNFKELPLYFVMPIIQIILLAVFVFLTYYISNDNIVVEIVGVFVCVFLVSLWFRKKDIFSTGQQIFGGLILLVLALFVTLSQDAGIPGAVVILVFGSGGLIWIINSVIVYFVTKNQK